MLRGANRDSQGGSPMREEKVVGWTPGDVAGPSPCDRCELARRCKVRLEACRAFAAYYEGVPEREWSALVREPNREIYVRILGPPRAGRPRLNGSR
jgi:hypothetical protein